MNKLRGLLCGAGFQEWDNNRTGEVEQRPRISLNDSGELPRLLEADPDVIRAARALPVGSDVELTWILNRYNQIQVKAIQAV